MTSTTKAEFQATFQTLLDAWCAEKAKHLAAGCSEAEADRLTGEAATRFYRLGLSGEALTRFDRNQQAA
jgi:hypothetical protein